MDDVLYAFKKWLGYFATGLIALLFFGIAGFFILMFAGYSYLNDLREADNEQPTNNQVMIPVQNPQVMVPHSSQTTRTGRITRHRHNNEYGKLPPDQVTPPIDRY